MPDETGPLSADALIRESRIEREKARRAIQDAQDAVAQHARAMRAEQDAQRARQGRTRRRPGYASPP